MKIILLASLAGLFAGISAAESEGQEEDEIKPLFRFQTSACCLLHGYLVFIHVQPR